MIIKDIDCNVTGSGTTVLYIPGSFSTPSAWKSVQYYMPDGFKHQSISLLGYGQTVERRTHLNYDMSFQIELMEVVLQNIKEPVHLVGHSFGGMIALAYLQRSGEKIKSVTLFEANPISILSGSADSSLLDDCIQMSEEFYRRVKNNDADAVKIIIDFYGGEGYYNLLPEKVRTVCKKGAATNTLDWKTGLSFNLNKQKCLNINLPIKFVAGSDTNIVMKRVFQALKKYFLNGSFEIIANAGHFLISSHPQQCAQILRNHILRNDEML